MLEAESCRSFVCPECPQLLQQGLTFLCAGVFPDQLLGDTKYWNARWPDPKLRSFHGPIIGHGQAAKPRAQVKVWWDPLDQAVTLRGRLS